MLRGSIRLLRVGAMRPSMLAFGWKKFASVRLSVKNKKISKLMISEAVCKLTLN